MPELPEVETVRRGLQPVLEGARIVRVEARRPDLRFPFPERFAERLEGRRVTALERRAKYLLAHVEGGPLLICHLGMSGSFRIEQEDGSDTPGAFHHERAKEAAHDHVVFHVEPAGGRPARVVFNDPRRFGFMLFAEGIADEHPMLAGLGVEPTGNALDGALLASLLEGKKAPLKAALLDQRLIAGLGNIYACEALFLAGISPRRSAHTVQGERADRLVAALKRVLLRSIDDGGSTLRDHVQPGGELGYFQTRFNVYDRAGAACPTPGCGRLVKRLVQGGRSTFYCTHCQR